MHMVEKDTCVCLYIYTYMVAGTMRYGYAFYSKNIAYFYSCSGFANFCYTLVAYEKAVNTVIIFT